MSKTAEYRARLYAVKDGGRRTYGWLALIALGLLGGLYGIARVLLEGTVVLGITSQLPWGILISTYEFFLLTSAGIVIGIVALSLVFGIERFDLVAKRAMVLALATLAAGLFTILIGLGRPERPAIHALINANPSAPIWWVIMFAGGFGAVLVALLLVVEIDRLRLPRLAFAVGALGLLAAIAVTIAAGMIFGTIQARPYYGGALAPLYFLLTGVFSGVAAVGLVVAIEDAVTAREVSGELRTLLTEYIGKGLGALAGAVLIVALVKALYGLTATSDSTAMAYEHMLLGSFAPIYWGLGIFIGLIVPILLMASPKTRTTTGVLAASAAALVGLFVTRYEFVVGGQVVALVADPSYQYPLVSYVPSHVEIALIVFALALCALVYTAGTFLLDTDQRPPRTEDKPMTTTTTTPTGGTDDD
ncbi:MAG: NrfD/PsrC family molybdoenzyme membrane anchor subunit [Halalkalicoccus sp.]